MVGSVRSRPGHYEVLGLNPAASEEEIGQAFANKMSLVAAHAPSAAAQVCMAFETLRDPVRRRDYDRSIGLMRGGPPLRRWTVPSAQLHWTPFIAAAAIEPPACEAPEPHVTAQGESSSSIAASPVVETGSSVRRQIVRPRRRPEGRPVRTEDSEDRAFAWRRPAAAVGVLLLAAALIGTVAGMSVRDGEEPAQAEPAAPAKLAAPQPHPVAVSVSPPAPVETTKPRTYRHHYRHTRTKRRRHVVPAQPSVAAPAPQPVVHDAAGEGPY